MLVPVDSFDEAFEPETPQVIGGLGRGVVRPPVRGHLGAQGLVGEAADDVGEGGHRAEERHGPGVAEAQAGARWPSWTLGSTIDSRVAGSGRPGRPSPRAAKKRALVAAPARRSAVQFSAVSVLCRAKSLALFTVVSTRRARPSFR